MNWCFGSCLLKRLEPRLGLGEQAESKRDGVELCVTNAGVPTDISSRFSVLISSDGGNRVFHTSALILAKHLSFCCTVLRRQSCNDSSIAISSDLKWTNMNFSLTGSTKFIPLFIWSGGSSANSKKLSFIIKKLPVGLVKKSTQMSEYVNKVCMGPSLMCLRLAQFTPFDSRTA